MNLIKNVGGSWELSKNLVRQDLDTIQTTINQILAQINAPVTPTPTPPATFSSANSVTTYAGDPLTSVSVDPAGALDGSGRAIDPLAVRVDGTTITINSSNKLVGSSGVTVDAAGALSGNGTGGSPLAVKVDGTTINIVGDQLSGAAGQQILFATGGITAAQAAALNSAPMTLISGVANSIIIPLSVSLHVEQVGPGGFGTSISPSLRYSTLATNILAFGQIATVADIPARYNVTVLDAVTTANIFAAGTGPVGDHMILFNTTDTATTPPATYNVTYRIAYYLLAKP